MEPLRTQPDYGENDSNPYARRVRGEVASVIIASDDEKSTGCLMAVFPDEFNTLIRSCADKLDKDSLLSDEEHTDGGIAERAHVSIKYGVEADTETVKKWCDDNLEPFNVTLTAADIFKNEDAWVLIMKCDDSYLAKLNKDFCKSVPHIDGEFEEYIPHMTVAYLKPDTECEEVIKFCNEQLGGKTAEITVMEYSDSDDNNTDIAIGH